MTDGQCWEVSAKCGDQLPTCGAHSPRIQSPDADTQAMLERDARHAMTQRANGMMDDEICSQFIFQQVNPAISKLARPL